VRKQSRQVVVEWLDLRSPWDQNPIFEGLLVCLVADQDLAILVTGTLLQQAANLIQNWTKLKAAC
jgi:hypothetical protein